MSPHPTPPTQAPDTLHGRFEAQARHRPNAIALSERGQHLSYQSLNTQADAQAARLRGLGVRPGDLVAVMLPRGINAIIQILAVLKAGAGYVPIDPHYPAQRVEWTLQTSQPICVLTTPSVCSTIWPDGPPEAPWCHLRSTSGEALGTGVQAALNARPAKANWPM